MTDTLLCDKCNRVLGFWQDNEDVMLGAIEYLRNSRLAAHLSAEEGKA